MMMDMVVPLTILLVIMGGWLWVWGKRMLRLRRMRREGRARHAAWVAAQPPIIEPDAQQLAAFRAGIAGLALPALVLTADPAAPVAAGGSRIGGPVWLPDGMDWPTGPDGRPLEFVAQLDFGAMPPLPDYPEAGLLQLFVGRDDLHGADFDAPDRGNFQLLFRPDDAPGGRMVPPPHLPRYGDPDDDGYSSTPFIDDAIRAHGVRLTATATSIEPEPFSWAIEALAHRLGVDVRSKAVDALFEEQWHSGGARRHFVGGHPVFTQQDYRSDGAFPPHDAPSPSPYRDYDRLLFQLSSENGLQWGDVGEANVMIRRDDLLARDFSRAIWWWDCT